VVWQHNLLDWLGHWQPDVLVMEANPRNASTNAAIRWMHARRRPVIGWGLGAPPLGSSPLARLFGGERRRFLAQFDALIAYSQTGARQFQAAGFPGERVFVAPNAATSRPDQPPPERPAVYQNGRPVVLFVGRLQARKRVDALLRACAALPEHLQPRLRIVGDGPAREMFEQVAREVYPKAEFIGARHGPGLDPEFAGADLFVLPGTGGLAVQQAMSHALPVMVAEADGTQSDLVRPENGWLLPPGDEEALTQKLADALADPAALRRMGAESYRIVAEEVNLERMVSVFAEVVKTVRQKD
jgi:glycosyltransferase involved in cell wall biosynthesis